MLRSMLRAGVYVVPFLPLYVSPSLLFPYITGRNFAFRILIELLLIPFVALCWVSKQHRPRLSVLTGALLAFVACVAVADVMGVDPYRSFWSTYQRMEGLLGLIHLALFFLILRTALEMREEWTRYFTLSIVVSALVTLVALFQFGILGGRAGGTIGNEGILGAYLLLHVFLCVMILEGESRAGLRRFLIGCLALDVLGIYITQTRAAMLPLLIVGGALVALRYRERAARATAAHGRVLMPVVLVVFSVTALAFLYRVIVRSINSGRSPRLMAWEAAWNAARERIWLGWGQENFAIAWDRYYVPLGLPFDRAHNIYLDWLLAGGILALAAFIVLVAALAMRLRSLASREPEIALPLGGFLAAYLMFGLFWFDTFEMWVPLIGVMAFVDRRLDVATVAATAPCSGAEPYVRSEASEAEPQTRKHVGFATSRFGSAPLVAVPACPRSARMGSAFAQLVGRRRTLRGADRSVSRSDIRFRTDARPLPLTALVSATAVVVVAAVYALNVRPMLLARDVVAGLNAWTGERDIAESLERFERAYAYPGLRSHEAVEQMASIVPQMVALRGRTEPEAVRRFVDRAIRELVPLATPRGPEGPPLRSTWVEMKHVQLLGTTYGSASPLGSEYRQAALDTFERGIALFPDHEQMYAAFARFHAAEGDFDAALTMQRKAARLRPDDTRLHFEALRFALGAGVPAPNERKTFRQYLSDTRALETLEAIAAGYLRSGDLEMARMVVEEMRRRKPDDPVLRDQYETIVRRLEQTRRLGPE